MTLEGTGLGSAAVENITVRLGGHSVPIAGIGAGMSPGVDQVRFLVPDDPAIPDGCYVQVAVIAGGSFSNAATMPTARNGSACVHPFDLSFQEMQALDSGGELMFGQAAISSSIVPVMGSLRRLESASRELSRV